MFCWFDRKSILCPKKQLDLSLLFTQALPFNLVVNESMRSAIAVLTYRRLNALKETLSGLSTWCSQYPLAVFEDAGQRDATSRWLVEGAEPLMERYDLEATE